MKDTVGLLYNTSIKFNPNDKTVSSSQQLCKRDTSHMHLSLKSELQFDYPLSINKSWLTISNQLEISFQTSDMHISLYNIHLPFHYGFIIMIISA